MWRKLRDPGISLIHKCPHFNCISNESDAGIILDKWPVFINHNPKTLLSPLLKSLHTEIFLKLRFWMLLFSLQLTWFMLISIKTISFYPTIKICNIIYESYIKRHFQMSAAPRHRHLFCLEKSLTKLGKLWRQEQIPSSD